MRKSILWGLLAVFAGSASALELGSYNVENLFDAVHDQDKTDWEYLPVGYPGKFEECQKEPKEYVKKCQSIDWSEAKVELKLGQVANVFLERGKFPDLLGMVEVENPAIVGRLMERWKKFGNLKLLMTNSPDRRGIDNALIYKESADLRLVRSGEVVLSGDNFEKKPTRNVLEVEFQVKGREQLVVYVNHWPSQAAPNDVRMEVARQLRRHIQKQYPNPETNIVLLGDFNVLAQDKPNPLGSVVASPFESAPAFLDAETEFWALQTKLGKEKELRETLPKGTYFYATDMSWNTFDHFYVSPALHDGQGLELNAASFQIYAPSSLKTDLKKGNKIEKGIPRKYNVNTTKASDAGVSDHFPLIVELAL